MKKFFTFLSLFVLIGVSANVFAQTNTGTAPFPGTSHDYTAGTSASTSGYDWWVTDGEGATITEASEIVTFAKVDAGDPDYTTSSDIASGSGFYRINITWGTASTGNTYYVHVKETDDNGCSNEKVLEIKPINTFDVAVANVTGLTAVQITSATVGSGDQTNSLCADSDVSVTLATTPSYDYGTTIVKFKIYPETILSGQTWQFDWDSSIALTGSVSSTTFVTDAGNTTGITTSGTTPEITVASTVAYVVATVTINNSDESAKTVTMSLSNIKDGLGNADIGSTNNEASHNILARPSTSSITAN